MTHLSRAARACHYIIVAAIITAGLSQTSARATSEGNVWYPIYTLQSPSGVSNLLWFEEVYNTSNVFLGSRAQLWALNSANAETSKGSVFAKGSGWGLGDVQYASNGTLRSSWFKSGTFTGGVYTGDSIQIWQMTAGGVETSEGPIYTKGAEWYSTGAGMLPDGTFRAIWVKYGTYGTGDVYSGDTVSIWTLNASGTETSEGPLLFKGAGWHYNGLVIASDESFRLEWSNEAALGGKAPVAATDAQIWTVSTSGAVTSQGPILSKGAGWNPLGLGIASSNNTLRLRWASDDYTTGIYSVAVWALTTGGAETSEGANFSEAKDWYPFGFTVTSGGDSIMGWILYSPAGEALKVSVFNSAGNYALTGPTYQPGGKWVADLGVPKTLANGDIQVVWILPPASASITTATGSVWTLNPTGTKLVGGPLLTF